MRERPSRKSAPRRPTRRRARSPVRRAPTVRTRRPSVLNLALSVRRDTSVTTQRRSLCRRRVPRARTPRRGRMRVSSAKSEPIKMKPRRASVSRVRRESRVQSVGSPPRNRVRWGNIAVGPSRRTPWHLVSRTIPPIQFVSPPWIPQSAIVWIAPWDITVPRNPRRRNCVPLGRRRRARKPSVKDVPPGTSVRRHYRYRRRRASRDHLASVTKRRVRTVRRVVTASTRRKTYRLIANWVTLVSVAQ
jgi:hypothetical protein